MAGVMDQLSLAEEVAVDQPWFYGQEPDVVNAAFARLRREAPVFWYEPGQFWVLAKHGDIKDVGRDTERFSTESGVVMAHSFDPAPIMDQLPDWVREPLSKEGLTRAEIRHWVAHANLSMGDPGIENLMLADPPRHDELRRIFTKALSPRLIREITETTERAADDVLTSFEPGSVHDFVTMVSTEVPARVTAHIVGGELVQDRSKFIEWSHAFFAGVDLTHETDPEKAARIKRLTGEFLAFLQELFEERRQNPGDDLVSGIVTSELDGKPMTPSMAMMFIGALFIGGGGSARHLVARVPQAFAEHRDARDLLIADRSLVPRAIEEVLRYYPITWSTCRTAVTDVEIRGETIREGDYVVQMFPSGNRDEEVWERPHEFDIMRSHQPGILAFGWGQHTCAGNLLARMTGRVVLDRMLEHWPNWELAGEPVRRCNLNKNMIDELPIRFLK